jgi:hypothetical protein
MGDYVPNPARDFQIYRNSSTHVTHIVTPGYINAWCGAFINSWLKYSNRGYTTSEWLDRATVNRDNRICKRCSSMWRSGR